MSASLDFAGLATRIKTAPFDTHTATRVLAVYSAAVTRADAVLLDAAVERSRAEDIPRQSLYEVVLQSYLFLGFPRMLIAAEHLHAAWPDGVGADRSDPPPLLPPDGETAAWVTRGLNLCKRVYGSSFDALRARVEPMAPEVFRWMIMEGYGKVLSRPQLDSVTRELSIVAFLMTENREQQLYSHLRGAINVGADNRLIRRVLDDLELFAPEGYRTSREILRKLEVT